MVLGVRERLPDQGLRAGEGSLKISVSNTFTDGIHAVTLLGKCVELVCGFLML